MSVTTSDGLNYLGTFEVIDEVYAAYPSGGVAGNFVVVDGVALYWDETTLRWVGNDGSTSDDSNVNGTLTANEVVIKDGFRTSDFREDTQGSALRKKNGEWELSVDKINVRNGADSFKGQSSFTSFVFIRSASKPTKPADNDGSYSSPVPSGGWSDGIPSGTLPVWVTSRIFTNDEELPQEQSWHDVRLLTDTITFDYELSPVAIDGDPGTPKTNPDDWYDPTDDASYIADNDMNWMATRTKFINASGEPEWSDWTVVPIRGEKGDDGDDGDDGVGATYVKVSRDTIVVDCDASGKVIGNHSFTITAELYSGDERLALVSQGCNFSYGGRAYAPTINDNVASQTFEFAEGSVLESGTINVLLSDYNPYTPEGENRHSALKDIAVLAPRRGTNGLQGDTGEPGPVPLMSRWESGKVYKRGASGEGVYNLVEHVCNWYRCIRTHTSSANNSPVSDNASAYWQLVDAVPFLIVEEGVVKLLHSQRILMNDGAGNPTAMVNGDNRGSYAILYPSGRKCMELKCDGFLHYYNDDEDNTEQWRLGYSGTVIQSNGDDWQPMMLYALGSSLSSVTFDNTTVYNRTRYWKFISQPSSSNHSHNGEILEEYNNTHPSSPVGATMVSGGYYTPNDKPVKVGLNWQITYYLISDGLIEEEGVLIKLPDGTYTTVDPTDGDETPVE